MSATDTSASAAEETIALMRSRHRVEARLDEILATKLRRRAQGVKQQTATIDQVRERLDGFLRTQIDGDFQLGEVAQLGGGGTNAQYRFRLAWDGRDETLVLRVKAPAAVVQTDVAREAQLIAAVQGVLPVPTAFWVDDDGSHFGEPAAVSGFVPGVAAPTEDVARATGLGTVYGPRLAPLLAPQFVEHLAKLHAHDWSGADLDLFDHPAAGTTEAIDLRLGLWGRVWDEDHLEVHPTILLTQQWLRDHRPECDHVSLLHGDYRNGNFLFDEATGELTGVLDWELGYLGDRHSDLGYAMMSGWTHTDEDGTVLCAGLVDEETFIRDYERLSGLPVDPVRLEYYKVLNLYWAAVALTATGPRIAVENQTHLDVMMNFISGLGAFNLAELDRVVGKA